MLKNVADTRVVVEAWGGVTGWHFGGYYDLKDPEQESQAKDAFREFRKEYSLVRCRRLYCGGEVDLFAAKERRTMADYDKNLEYISQTQTLVGQKKRDIG